MNRANTWICPECFDEETGPMEFKTFEAYQEHMQKAHGSALEEEKAVVEPLAGSQPPKKADLEPVRRSREAISLTYKYQGRCPACGTEVETIELEAEKGKQKICVAWCPVCKVSREQRKVPALTAHDYTSKQKSK
jgi:CRISPR/Cas system-associated protein Cas10 (large subunit of type III CRISPR-Cas system)